MARQVNSFALLDDEEVDDVSTFIERVAAKVGASSLLVEKKQKNQKSQSNVAADAANLPLKPLPPSDSVRGERGRGRGGRGPSSGRFGSGGNEVEQFGNSNENGYHHNYKGADSYQQNFKGGNGADGYHRNYGEVKGNQRNYGGSNGHKRNYGGANDDQWHHGGDSAPNVDYDSGRGRGRGGGRGRGRGRGRVFDENNGSGNEQEVVVNQQLKNQEQNGNGWEQVNENQRKAYGSESRSLRDEERTFRNASRRSVGDNRGYGGGNRDFRGRGVRPYGVRDGRNENVEVSNNSETGEVLSGEKGNPVNVDNSSSVTEWDAPVTAEVVDDAEPKQEKLEARDSSEQKKFEVEEDNEMTLEEYEKLLFEKKAALEALKKPVERKVTLDKDFESMQLVEKKKEDGLFIKLKSEKDKLKKKEILDKEEKARKSVSINEFLKPAEGEMRTHGRGGRLGRGRGGDGDGRGRGRGDRSEFKGVFSGRRGLVDHTPALEDPGQFPVLGGAIKA